MGADETTASDLDAPDAQHPAFHSVAGSCVSAPTLVSSPIRTRSKLEQWRSVEGAAASHLRAHQTIIDAISGVPAENPGAADGLQPRHHPPAEIIRAPKRVGASAVASDDQPFGGDAQRQHCRPERQHDRRGEPGCRDRPSAVAQEGIGQNHYRGQGEHHETPEKQSDQGLQQRKADAGLARGTVVACLACDRIGRDFCGWILCATSRASSRTVGNA